MSSSGSDSGDEDYIPSDGGSQPPSEVESDGEEEDSDVCNEEENENESKGKKRMKKHKGHDDSPQVSKTKEETEDIKQKSESLWSDFLKDVSQDGDGTEGSSSDKIEAKKEKGVITQVYEFAGEKVSICKEVDAEIPAKKRKVSTLAEGSKDNALEVRERENTLSEDKSPTDKPIEGERKRSVLGLSAKSHAITKPNVRCGGGGSILGSALDKLGKKNKLSTLEKSKLDWESYKSKEGINEEISAHNKGKSGFLDKRDFLEKTDLKQYELEKQLRNSQRSKR